MITLGDAANVMAALVTVVIALHVVLWRVSSDVDALSKFPCDGGPDGLDEDRAHLQQRERRMNGALFVAGSSACWVAIAAVHTEIQRALTISWGHLALAVIAVTCLALAIDRPRSTWRRQVLLARQREDETTANWHDQHQMLGSVPLLNWSRLALWLFVLVAGTVVLAIGIEALLGYASGFMATVSLTWTLGSLVAGAAWVEGRIIVWAKVYAVLLWVSLALTLIGAVLGALAAGSLSGVAAWVVATTPAALVTWQVLGRRDLGPGSGPVEEYWRWRVERTLAKRSKGVRS